ncbi:MAG: hypothetical protein IKR85_03595 [Clostridia bacterium]|nr:hypothetical protein [Clostridia bacterium]
MEAKYHTQSTRADRMSPLFGILLVVLIVAALFALDFLLTYLMLRHMIGDTLRTVILLACAGALLVFVFTRYALVSVYEVDGVKITFSRIYVKKPRLMEQILLREAVMLSEPEEAAQKYACESTKRFTTARSPYPVRALVYKRSGAYHRILFNPNEEISTALSEALAKK